MPPLTTSIASLSLPIPMSELLYPPVVLPLPATNPKMKRPCGQPKAEEAGEGCCCSWSGKTSGDAVIHNAVGCLRLENLLLEFNEPACL